MARARRAVVAAIALAGVAVGCTGGKGVERVTARASVLADASKDIRSGRIEMSAGKEGAGVLLFDGDDMAVQSVKSAGSATEADPSKIDLAPDAMRIVGGVTYVQGSSRRWTKTPDMFGESMSKALPGLATIAGAMRDVVVKSPGVPARRDGVAVVRYTTTLDGRTAAKLFGEGSGLFFSSSGSADTTGGTSVPGAGGSDDFVGRANRMTGYAESHTTVEVRGEVDGAGRLVRLEMDQRRDNTEYPDCGLLKIGADNHLVMTEINRPQKIVAPPAHQVEESDPSDGSWSEGAPEDPAAQDPATQDSATQDSATQDPATTGPAVLPQPATLSTASGERQVHAVLDYLRRWADRHDVDWKKMSIPDNDQMVARFDRFYAQDVVSMGPELSTSTGSWPRGYLVEVVAGNPDVGEDPAAVSKLPDDQLVGRFEQGTGGLSDGLGNLDSVGSALDEVFKGCPP